MNSGNFWFLVHFVGRSLPDLHVESSIFCTRETALRVSQSRAGLWGKLGNLLFLLPPLPRGSGWCDKSRAAVLPSPLVLLDNHP